MQNSVKAATNSSGDMEFTAITYFGEDLIHVLQFPLQFRVFLLQRFNTPTCRKVSLSVR